MRLPPPLCELARRSAAPGWVLPWLEQAFESGGDLARNLAADPLLAELAVTVVAASRSLARLLSSEPAAVGLLAAGGGTLEPPDHVSTGEELARWKRLELLRIAAGDLAGIAAVDEVGGRLAAMGDSLLEASCRLAGAEGLSVIAMGKLGARELNYASDVDVLFVGDGGPAADAAARRVLDVARRAVRVDANLRPEGRDGPLVRSLESYAAYWDRWARPWEFQALIKARWAAGDGALGARFEAEAAARVWERGIGAEALTELRSMKARSEEAIVRRGLHDREIKLGRGGIRDVEFAVQLLQLVHGPADPALRLKGTVPALGELAVAGYVARDDAVALTLAYRFLRTVEHRLQLVEEAQVHTLPEGTEARERLARVLGFRRGAHGNPEERLTEVLARHQATVRSIHERLYFRPLLEAFTSPAAALDPVAARERLAAFGFREADRTRQALEELTRGLSRSSRLMKQLLPLLLDWCSASPDPDLALLGLRTFVGGAHPRDMLVTAFRESPEVARRLCILAGTSRDLVELLRRHPELVMDLGDDAALAKRSAGELRELACVRAGGSPDRAPGALRRFVGVELTRVVARDVLDVDDVVETGRALASLAEAALAAALDVVRPPLPFAVIAMGRLGGAELAYGSDLDVLLVYDGTGPSDAAAAEVSASSFLRLLNGATPAEQVIPTDVALRPEGRHGPPARSLEAYAEYYERWVQTWERQSLLRARPVAGDAELGARFMELASAAVWQHPVGDDVVRDIRRMKARIERERLPPGADPQFHLKLGRGSLSDVEWTAQLLQLRSGTRATGTVEALRLLEAGGHLSPADSAVLQAAYRFCERTRDRWHLIGGHLPTVRAAGRTDATDALPRRPEQLSRLARSLATTPAGLREDYRRVTRRARNVVERLFYGL